jgi:hypothetical protein
MILTKAKIAESLIVRDLQAVLTSDLRPNEKKDGFELIK